MKRLEAVLRQALLDEQKIVVNKSRKDGHSGAVVKCINYSVFLGWWMAAALAPSEGQRGGRTGGHRGCQFEAKATHTALASRKFRLSLGTDYCEVKYQPVLALKA